MAGRLFHNNTCLLHGVAAGGLGKLTMTACLQASCALWCLAEESICLPRDKLFLQFVYGSMPLAYLLPCTQNTDIQTSYLEARLYDKSAK